MATPSDLKSLQNIRNAAGNALPVVPPFPALPQSLKKQFPELRQWEQQVAEWRQKVNVVLGFSNG